MEVTPQAPPRQRTDSVGRQRQRQRSVWECDAAHLRCRACAPVATMSSARTSWSSTLVTLPPRWSAAAGAFGSELRSHPRQLAWGFATGHPCMQYPMRPPARCRAYTLSHPSGCKAAPPARPRRRPFQVLAGAAVLDTSPLVQSHRGLLAQPRPHPRPGQPARLPSRIPLPRLQTRSPAGVDLRSDSPKNLVPAGCCPIGLS
mmetsp:Transcript_96513/g.282089  ORF Transcript_96513/g.282089 Transcript_96513/m.282089 type:complete len:202 (+) Transcript_96513:333-938(+)